jgi:hypothetical protein
MRIRKKSARQESAWKCLGTNEDMGRECERAESGGFLPLRVATLKGETVYGMIMVLHLINEGVLEGLNGLDFEQGFFYFEQLNEIFILALRDASQTLEGCCTADGNGKPRSF